MYLLDFLLEDTTATIMIAPTGFRRRYYTTPLIALSMPFKKKGAHHGKEAKATIHQAAALRQL